MLAGALTYDLPPQ
jgi:hypothetical protein